MSAEHLKNSHSDVINIITLLLESIDIERTIPSQMRQGLITPVFIQKKYAWFPDNCHSHLNDWQTAGKILVIPTKAILRDNITVIHFYTQSSIHHTSCTRGNASETPLVCSIS